MKIVIASDHGGLQLKLELQSFLAVEHDVLDAGCSSDVSVDYPDYAEKAVKLYREGADFIILVCGTGIGISIAANKMKGVRCALCTNEFEAEMARKHNNANALALGGRVIGVELGKSIVKRFLETAFEGGRHQARLDKLAALEG